MAKTSSPRRTTSTASPPVCPPTCPRSWPPSARSARGIPCARSGPESCCSSLIVGPLLFDDTPILNLADLDLATRPAKGSYTPPAVKRERRSHAHPWGMRLESPPAGRDPSSALPAVPLASGFDARSGEPSSVKQPPDLAGKDEKGSRDE